MPMPLSKCLVLVVIVIPLFAQAPSTSREKITEPNRKQRDAQNPPSRATVPTHVAAQPSQAASTPNATTTKNQTKKTWGDYLGEAFGPSTWSNWFLGIFAAIAAVIGLKTLSAINEQ